MNFFSWTKKEKKARTCPVCNGAGTTSRPPWVDGDSDCWMSGQSGGYTCKTCKGRGIVVIE